MKRFVAAVRAKTSRRVWDRGVELARSGAVAGSRDDGDELELRVRAPERAVAPTVVLYLEDDDWDCDCGARGVCSHVVAAALTASRAREQGEALPAGAKAAQIRYRLDVDGDRLELVRVIVVNGEEQPLTTRLWDARSKVLVSAAELALDRLVDGRARARLLPAQVPEALEHLAEVSDLWLGDSRVSASADIIAPRGIVRDGNAGGVVLVLEAEDEIDEVVAPGVARAGDTLHPLGETELTGPRLEALPFERPFAARELATLVTGLLAELSQRIVVDIHSDRLPGISRSIRPRIALEIEQAGDELSVLPLLVYGEPRQARIDGDRLVHLGGEVPVRDRDAEKRLALRLRDEVDLAVGRRVTVNGADAIALARKLGRWKRELGSAATRLFRDQALVANVEFGEDSFEVSFATPDGSHADPGAVLAAWRSGESLVPLLGGGWAPLPTGFLDEHGHAIADLALARQPGGRVRPHALPDLARLCRSLDHPEPPGLERLRPLLESFEHIPEAPLPGDLTAELRDYQREGVSWLLFLRQLGVGGVLADDMGLGKTVQSLCAITGRALVVCPTSVLHNWAAEISRFRPALSTHVYHGPSRALLDAADVTLTTYAILRNDIERLEAIRWDTVILDEAQAIKNPDSQVTRAAYRIDAEFRLTLTGTPVENRLDELWSQLHFTNPGLLGGRADFRDRYERPIASGDPGVASRLRARIRPFLLRRLKSEVARELPPRTEMVLQCELDKGERAAYDTIRAAARAEIVERLAKGGNVLAALEALLRLRQASCHRGLLPNQEASRSSKVELLMEILDEAVAEGHKALVFSQWTSLLDLVEPHLTAADVPFTRLDGSTRDRGAVVAEFQDPGGPPVMLISLKAGGTGLNLTAADHVILLDPWWNPAVEDQAADRAHRIGQDKPVLVYRLVARDTVEERVLGLQARKRAIADAALGGADRAASISRDELLELLG